MSLHSQLRITLHKPVKGRKNCAITPKKILKKHRFAKNTVIFIFHFMSQQSYSVNCSFGHLQLFYYWCELSEIQRFGNTFSIKRISCCVLSAYMGVGRGEQGVAKAPYICEIFRKKVFFSFEWKKTNFTTFNTPREKFWKIPYSAHPSKKSFLRPWVHITQDLKREHAENKVLCGLSKLKLAWLSKK